MTQATKEDLESTETFRCVQGREFVAIFQSIALFVCGFQLLQTEVFSVILLYMHSVDKSLVSKQTVTEDELIFIIICRPYPGYCS